MKLTELNLQRQGTNPATPPEQAKTVRKKKSPIWLHLVQWSLLLLGVGCLLWVGWVLLDTALYQEYQSRQFEERLNRLPSDPAGPPTPGESVSGSFRAFLAEALNSDEELEVVGRLTIPRLELSAIVSDGVADETLRKAVGRIPGTARPDEPGNIGIAGHRDSFFRPLKDVKKGDRIELESLSGSYQYEVEWTRIVTPDQVEVLDPTETPALTLVTCYPFSYVGSAPKRFIVRARKVDPLLDKAASPNPSGRSSWRHEPSGSRTPPEAPPRQDRNSGPNSSENSGESDPQSPASRD